MPDLTRIRHWAASGAVTEHLFPIALIVVLTLGFFAPRLWGFTFSAVGHHTVSTYPWLGASPPPVPLFGRGYPQTDHAETYYPMSVFATQAWRGGEIPMWMPYSFGGFPMLELGMTSMLYPPRVLLLLVCDPIWQHDLMMLLHVLVAGLGMYGLLRCWGAQAAGAVLGAVVWQFNGHNVFWLVLEQMAMVAAWCPLMLLAATLAVRRRSYKWATACGMAVGLALYTGGTHYVHWSGWLLAIWYGTEVVRAASGELRRRQPVAALHYVLLPCVSLLTALMVGMAYWLPLLQAVADVARQPLNFELQAAQGFPLKLLLQDAWLPLVIRQTVLGFDYGSFGFVGLGALAAALAGLLLSRARHVRIAFLFLIFSLLTLNGAPWWLHLLYGRLPFFNTMNLHVFFYLYCFAVAVLAAFGVSELQRRWRVWKEQRARGDQQSGWGLFLLSLCLMAATTVQMGVLLVRFRAIILPLHEQIVDEQLIFRTQMVAFLLLTAVTLCLLALYVRASQRGGLRWRAWWQALRARAEFTYLLTVMAALSLILFAWMTIPFHAADTALFFPATPFVTRLQQLPQAWRALPLYAHRPIWTSPVFPGKSGAIFGLPLGHGYESLLPARTTALWQTVQDGGTPADLRAGLLTFRPYFLHDQVPIKLLENLSVGWLITSPDVEPQAQGDGRNLVADGTLRLVYRGSDGWIYEHRRALRRAFLVTQTTLAPDAAQALRLLSDTQFNARQTAIIEQPLVPEEMAQLAHEAPLLGDDSARIVRESLNQIELETSAPQAALLVLNDSWASGWRATVDGAPQVVRRINFNARGVLVPGGTHRVVFRYRPPLLLLSLSLSALACVLLGGWLIGAHLTTALRRRTGTNQRRDKP